MPVCGLPGKPFMLAHAAATPGGWWLGIACGNQYRKMIGQQASDVELCPCADAVEGLRAATRERKRDMAVRSRQAMLASMGMTGVSARAEMVSEAEMVWPSSKPQHCTTDLCTLLTAFRAPAAERALPPPRPRQAASWHGPWLP